MQIIKPGLLIEKLNLSFRKMLKLLSVQQLFTLLFHLTFETFRAKMFQIMIGIFKYCTTLFKFAQKMLTRLLNRHMGVIREGLKM